MKGFPNHKQGGDSGLGYAVPFGVCWGFQGDISERSASTPHFVNTSHGSPGANILGEHGDFERFCG